MRYRSSLSLSTKVKLCEEEMEITGSGVKEGESESILNQVYLQT